MKLVILVAVVRANAMAVLIPADTSTQDEDSLEET